MDTVSVSQFRQHLPAYLERVAAGEELQVTSRGRVVARMIPVEDPRQSAKQRLQAWRATAVVGDVESPIAEAWDVDRDPA